MSEFISAKEVMEKWQIRDFELYFLVCNELLIPIDDLGKVIYHPEQQKQVDEFDRLYEKLRSRAQTVKNQKNDAKFSSRKEIIERIKELKKSPTYGTLGWGIFQLPKNRKQAKKIIAMISNCLFWRRDIDKMEKDENLVKLYHLKVPQRDDEGLKLAEKPKRTHVELEDHELIKEIGEEAERVYRYVVRAVGVTDTSIKSRSERRTYVANFYKENESTFKHLKDRHLSDLAIFDFKSNQSKRDYMRRLLKIIFEDMFPDRKFSGATLYKTYKEIS